jgi:putative nucleotidyltransferase with HDIG domain
MRLLKRNIELTAALIYLAAASLWIWLTDLLLVQFIQDPARLTLLQTIKGWFFVVATSVILYLVLHAYTRRQRQQEAERYHAEERLRESEEHLRKAYEATIEGWSLAMDLHDKEIVGHTRRVTEMTVAMARWMQLPEEKIIHIRHGALLHDIGKMGIPDEILRKPDQLTDEERAIMEKHPMYAFEMLESIAYLDPALEIPLLHHERWDGSGYPFGYRGKQIPISARIFAVIDVYDALTSDRPYRDAVVKADALHFIRAKSGQHFDPDVVQAFLEFIEVWEENGIPEMGD